MAGQLSFEIKAGPTESLTNPVGETKLTEMYRGFTKRDMKRIRKQLNTNPDNRSIAEEVVKVCLVAMAVSDASGSLFNFSHFNTLNTANELNVNVTGHV